MDFIYFLYILFHALDCTMYDLGFSALGLVIEEKHFASPSSQRSRMANHGIFQIVQNTNQSLPNSSNCSIRKYGHLLASMATHDFSWALSSYAVLCCSMVCMKLSLCIFFIIVGHTTISLALLFVACTPIHDVLSVTVLFRLFWTTALISHSELMHSRPTIHLLQENKIIIIIINNIIIEYVYIHCCYFTWKFQQIVLYFCNFIAR